MKNDTSFSIKLIRFSKPNAEKFSAILDLAEFGLQSTWKIVTTTDANFYVLPKKPKTHNYKGLPRERCFYYSTDVAGSNKANAMRIDASQTPCLHSLLQLLNRLASQAMSVAATVVSEQSTEKDNASVKLESKAKSVAMAKETQLLKSAVKLTVVPANVPGTLVSDTVKSSFFNPKQGFLKQLLETKSSVVFTLPGLGEKKQLYINPSQQAFYCSTPLKQTVLSFSFDDGLSSSILSQAQLSKMVKKMALNSKPLNNLIWYAVVQISQGRMMQGHSSQDIIQLIQWPYLGNDNPDYIKLTALLRKHPVSLESAAKKTGVTPARAVDFYNACYLIGLIKNEALENNATFANEKQGWLNKIKNKLIK